MRIVHGRNCSTLKSDRDEGSVSEDLDSFAKSTLNGKSGTEKVLGVQWDCIGDRLIMDIAHLFAEASVDTITKRQVLAISSKIYDPLGIISPVTVELKIFHQQLCRQKTEWDECVSEEDLATRRKLVTRLKAMQPVNLPRWYFTGTGDGKYQSISLHGFSDASCKAYVAVVYMVVATSTGIDVQLVTSKSRVAPLVKQSIPRLELLAALIPAWLMHSVQSALEGMLLFDSVHCWTDSQVTLYWIRGEQHEWKQFVQNRVNEI